MEAQINVSDAAAKATLAIAQAILRTILTRSHPSRGARAAEQSFDGIRDKAEQSVQSIHITVMMQLDTFVDERMKILYALSFMHGVITQVWAKNETNAVLSHSSTFSSWFHLSSIISWELCLGMFDHTQCSGHSSV